MEKKSCYICGKETLDKSEIGLTKKLLDERSRFFYCMDCLAEYLEVDTDFLLEKIDIFKEEGCIHF